MPVLSHDRLGVDGVDETGIAPAGSVEAERVFPIPLRQGVEKFQDSILSGVEDLGRLFGAPPESFEVYIGSAECGRQRQASLWLGRWTSAPSVVLGLAATAAESAAANRAA